MHFFHNQERNFKMQAGFAVCDITPSLGIYLTGYGRPERLATNIHSALNASVMYLADDKTEAVVIGIDWCYVDDQVSEEIRQGISKASGVPAKHIMLCCAHTHSAPHTAYASDTWRGAIDKEKTGAAYAVKCIPVIADAVCRAKNDRREVAVAFKAGKTETGISRRGMHETGEVNMLLGDPNMIYDSNMTVAHFIDRETRESIGIMVHCSAHNTAMGITTDISSDWCGVMKKRIATRYPVPVVFINGALGDVGPRTNRWFGDEDYRGFSGGCGDGVDSVLEVGYRASHDALALLEDLRDFRTDLKLDVHIGNITLPQAIHMTESKAREELGKFDEKTIDPDKAPVEYQLAKAALEAWQQPPVPTKTFEHVIVAFGPVALAGFPLEVFSVFSLRLRHYGPYEYTLLCSQVNGYLSYMPDRGAIACGGYEVLVRRVMRPYVFTPDAGDKMIVQTLSELREMHP